MVNKRFFKILVFVCVLLYAGTELFAQESGESAYYVTEDAEGNQIVRQKFTWDKSEDVLKYVFKMEQKDKKGNFVQIYEEETVKTSVETTMQAGEYRYKIFVYNFLGLLEVETDWIYIEIIKAYQPKISNVGPTVLYMEEEQDGVFTIDGSDLTENTIFSLSTSHKNADGKLKAVITENSRNGRHVKIQFNPDDLNTGTYSLIATNPGGLREFYDSIIIRWKKPTDFDISFGYAPLYIVYDKTFADYFGSGFIPLGANFRMAFIPIKKKTYSFGAALSTSGGYITNETDKFTVSTAVVSSNLQFVFQKYLYKRQLMLDFHAGAGVTGMLFTTFEFPNEVYSKPFNGIYLNLNAGLVMQYYVTKRAYLEAGVDYNHSFLPNMQFGFIQPSLSFGYQF